jgi:hypothetical protein
VTETADDRSGAQRCHDGIKLGLQAGIASGALGTHRGHPVTVIVPTTLAELNQAAHAATNPDIAMPSPARTGGHSALPMRDVIRMGADAIHYLAVFQDHTQRPIYLGRQTRIASTDQRILCYARDGGCTRPGCQAPGYHCEVHHSPQLGGRRRHRCRLPVLRLRPRSQAHHRRALPNRSHRHRPPRLDRRHHTTRHQPRPPPRTTPER